MAWAQLEFCLWGACHGVYLIVHKLYMNTVTWCPSGAALWIGHIVTIPITFMLVTLTWIPFVSTDIDATYNAFKHLLTWAEADTAGEPLIYSAWLSRCY